MLANEKVFRSEAEIKAGLLQDLAGDAGVCGAWLQERGAARRPQSQAPGSPPSIASSVARPISTSDPLMVMEWVDLFALAVNEENAAEVAW